MQSINKQNYAIWFSIIVIDISIYISLLSFIMLIYSSYLFNGATSILVFPSILFLIYIGFACANAYSAILLCENLEKFLKIYKNFIIMFGITIALLFALDFTMSTSLFYFYSHVEFAKYFVYDWSNRLRLVLGFSIYTIIVWIFAYWTILKLEQK